MKHIFYLLLLVFSLCNTSCYDEEDFIEPSQRVSKTVIFYVAAQNSLGVQGVPTTYHQQDSIELVAGARYMKTDERILLFVDDQHPPRLYEITHKHPTPRLLKKWKEELNTAKPEVLTEVLEFALKNAPSREYALVLWSHATGWIPSPKTVKERSRQALNTVMNPRNSPLSFGIDVGKGGSMWTDRAANNGFADEMEVEQLATAIRNSGIRLKYILFDCCLMQDIESLYALRHAADYIAGSPMSIPAEGGYYIDLVKDGLFATDIRRLGETYVSYYQGKGSKQPTEYMGIVFSIVRTQHLEALAQSVAPLLPPARKTPSATTFDFWDMGDTQHYAPYTARYFYRPHYYDMNDAMRRQLSSKDYEQFRSALDKVVVFKGGTPYFWVGPSNNAYLSLDLENYCGISMFVPQAIYSNYAHNTRHGDLNQAFRYTQWYEAAGWKAAGW